MKLPLLWLTIPITLLIFGCDRSYLSRYTNYKEELCENRKIEVPCLWENFTSNMNEVKYFNKYGSSGLALNRTHSSDSNITHLSYQPYGYITSRLSKEYPLPQEQKYWRKKFKKAKNGLIDIQLIRKSPTGLDPNMFKISISNSEAFSRKNTSHTTLVSGSIYSIRRIDTKGLWFNQLLFKIDSNQITNKLYVKIVDSYLQETLVFEIMR